MSTRVSATRKVWILAIALTGAITFLCALAGRARAETPRLNLTCARLEKIEGKTANDRILTFLRGKEKFRLHDKEMWCVRQGTEYILWYNENGVRSARVASQPCSSLSS